MSWRKAVKRLLFSTLILVYVSYALFPIYWLAITSFKTRSEIFMLYPTIFPRKLTVNNFMQVLRGEGIGVNFMSSLRNTVIIAIVVTSINLLLGGLAGYGISRAKSRIIYGLPLLFLLFSLTPPQTYAVPIFITLRKLGLLDTLLGLIFVYTAFSLPLPIWFLSQYFKSVPKEFEEAALVDGCSRVKVIFKIMFPLASPALCTSAIFTFMHTWNEFFFASILTSRRAMTMPVAIMSFQDARVMAWDLSTAASMLAIVPLIVVLTVLQKYVIQGLTAGGLKG